jgi:hypothetical protein
MIYLIMLSGTFPVLGPVNFRTMGALLGAGLEGVITVHDGKCCGQGC